MGLYPWGRLIDRAFSATCLLTLSWGFTPGLDPLCASRFLPHHSIAPLSHYSVLPSFQSSSLPVFHPPSVPDETKQPAPMVLLPIHVLLTRLPIAVAVARAKMAKIVNRFRSASNGVWMKRTIGDGVCSRYRTRGGTRVTAGMTTL
jgi:hypothetical protein